MIKVKVCFNQKNNKYEKDSRLGKELLVPIENLRGTQSFDNVGLFKSFCLIDSFQKYQYFQLETGQAVDVAISANKKTVLLCELMS
jgi:hypothetical protein